MISSHPERLSHRERRATDTHVPPYSIFVPDQRTKLLGWLSAITSLGAVVDSVFRSLMISIDGQQMLGITAAGVALIAAAVAWRYLRESWTPEHAEHEIAPITGIAAIRHVLVRWHDSTPRLIWLYAIAIGASYGTSQTVPLALKYRLCLRGPRCGAYTDAARDGVSLSFAPAARWGKE